MNRSASDLADAAAVAACGTGSTSALELLYTRHAAACLALARSILVDPHHAEDAVQEAYLDLWRGAARFDSDRSPVRAWLMLLTHRRAVDRVRSEQRRQTLALVQEHDRPDSRPGPEAQALIGAVGSQARAALQTLTPAKREAMVLAYWGGYTQREIAGLTGTPLGTVKTRMRAAMQELHQLLAERTPVAGADATA